LLIGAAKRSSAAGTIELDRRDNRQDGVIAGLIGQT
jgi:hypothetical protein